MILSKGKCHLLSLFIGLKSKCLIGHIWYWKVYNEVAIQGLWKRFHHVLLSAVSKTVLWYSLTTPHCLITLFPAFICSNSSLGSFFFFPLSRTFAICLFTVHAKSSMFLTSENSFKETAPFLYMVFSESAAHPACLVGSSLMLSWSSRGLSHVVIINF